MTHPTLLATGAVFRRLAPLVYTLLLFAAFPAPPAHAVTLDEAASRLEKGRRVYDFANVLSTSDEARIQDRLESLEQSGMAQGVVLMLDRLQGATIQEFALGIGERWRVGRADSDNGFVLVASIADRKYWIEVGKDLQGTLTDSVTTRLAQDNLRPAFRQQQYARGIEGVIGDIRTRMERAGGVEAIPVRPVERPSEPAFGWFVLFGLATIGTAAVAFPRGRTAKADPSRLVAILLGIAALATALLAASATPQFTGLYLILAAPSLAFAALRLFEGSWTPARMEDLPALRSRFATYFWAGLGALLLAGFFLQRWETLLVLVTGVPLGLLLPGYFQRLPRKCPDCCGELRWLPEKDEPARLKQEEDLEQRLGSMEYDVWHCSRCDKSAVIARYRVFSGYGECPRCHRRTLRTRTEMTQQPTAFADGWMDEITECVNPRCGHTDVRRKTVERRGYGWDSGPGVIILPGGWGGGGGWQGGDSGGGGGGFGGGGFDVGDFGGGGGFDGGGGGGDW